MKKIIFSGVILCIGLIIALLLNKKDKTNDQYNDKPSSWDLQAIDTVKYSRDVAREKLNDPNFEQVIDRQVKNIAETGATHISLGTPYDQEFIPFLTKWVLSARKYGLKVWFRGNFSGWEGWFNYETISKEAHLEKTNKFIIENPELFADGDIFTACTECENGSLGDPRNTGQVSEYRNFLIELKNTGDKAFHIVNKDVKTNYFSMNGDVAELIMDRDTTHKLNGVIVIDHYVESVDELIDDINSLVSKTGGTVVLGEIGAPILDIHGNLTEKEQAHWIDELFAKLVQNSSVVGVNYWTNIGSSSAVWKQDGSETQAVEVIKKYYKPNLVKINIQDKNGKAIDNIQGIINNRIYRSQDGVIYSICIPDLANNLRLSAEGYQSTELLLNCNKDNEITLEFENRKLLDKILDKVF